MTETATGNEDHDQNGLRERLLDAVLPHVPFDGWSEAAFRASARDVGVSPALARAACPRGALDLARAWHARGDAEMVRRLEAEDLAALRFRDRIARAIRLRLEAASDPEIARRSAALFSLPHHAAEGASMIWRTADLIWTALDDTDEDINWYTKRATLSGVYSGTMLFWLGDTSLGHDATWAFLERRIDEVMRFEKAKRAMTDNSLARTLLAGPRWAMQQVRAPRHDPASGLPGRFGPQAPRRS